MQGGAGSMIRPQLMHISVGVHLHVGSVQGQRESGQPTSYGEAWETVAGAVVWSHNIAPLLGWSDVMSSRRRSHPVKCT